MQPPRIYNLFPRLIGSMTAWPEYARRAQAMGFDWFYVNPFHFPGFSGSMYAVKDYQRIDPLLLPDDHPDNHYDDTLRGDGGMGLLRQVVAEIRRVGLNPMMDLVINHTSRDATLVRDHSEWFRKDDGGEVRSPRAIDPADARQVTVWGDLAELDHAGTADREGLWQYLEDLVRGYAEIGFVGFRCDAAYHVPAELWQRLIGAATRQQEETRFFGETLGARLEEIEALAPAGFHYIFNSSKWWDFGEPWAIEQQHAHRHIAPSISFPESHDTPRLWQETGGSVAVQRQRYAFAAAFATGVMMPIGYELGLTRQLHVVDTRPEHLEEPATDQSDFVARVNALKLEHPMLASEEVEMLSGGEDAVLVLAKPAGDRQGWVVLNKGRDAGCALGLDGAYEGLRGARVLRPCRDDGAGSEATGSETAGEMLELQPAEVVYLIGSRG